MKQREFTFQMTFSLPSPLPSPSLLLKLPVLSKATVKRAAKTCNVFCNIAAKQVEKRCCAFFAHVQTCLGTNQVVASCVNSLTRELRHCCKNVCFGLTKRVTSTDFAAKLRTILSTFCKIIRNLHNLICCKISLSSNSARLAAVFENNKLHVFCCPFHLNLRLQDSFFFFVTINRYSDCVSFIKVKTLPRGTILSNLF